jgi:hypothetical protein
LTGNRTTTKAGLTASLAQSVFYEDNANSPESTDSVRRLNLGAEMCPQGGERIEFRESRTVETSPVPPRSHNPLNLAAVRERRFEANRRPKSARLGPRFAGLCNAMVFALERASKRGIIKPPRRHTVEHDRSDPTALRACGPGLHNPRGPLSLGDPTDRNACPNVHGIVPHRTRGACKRAAGDRETNASPKVGSVTGELSNRL